MCHLFTFKSVNKSLKKYTYDCLLRALEFGNVGGTKKIANELIIVLILYI